jgi:hypothetical protein
MTRPVKSIAAALEALVSEIFPDAVKSEDKLDAGFGFGKGYKDLVFVISPQKEHVNLGIARGAELKPASRLLQGSGKVHRHVKIRTREGLADPELKRLMKRALSAARKRRDGGG